MATEGANDHDPAQIAPLTAPKASGLRRISASPERVAFRQRARKIETPPCFVRSSKVFTTKQEHPLHDVASILNCLHGNGGQCGPTRIRLTRHIGSHDWEFCKHDRRVKVPQTGHCRNRLSGNSYEAAPKIVSILPLSTCLPSATARSTDHRCATTKSSARTRARIRRYIANFGKANSSLYMSL